MTTADSTMESMDELVAMYESSETEKIEKLDNELRIIAGRQLNDVKTILKSVYTAEDATLTTEQRLANRRAAIDALSGRPNSRRTSSRRTTSEPSEERAPETSDSESRPESPRKAAKAKTSKPKTTPAPTPEPAPKETPKAEPDSLYNKIFKRGDHS